MQNKRLEIRRIVSYINDEESDGGGFWLPNIQRPFVWSEYQITRLFDSIMREYPISTLLVWRTKEEVKHRRFISDYRSTIKLTDFYKPDNKHSKLMVLDGQQRLQSLYIGLKGSHEGKQLYFDILSGQHAAPEDIRFKFEFKNKSEVAWPWVLFKDIIFKNNKLDFEIAEDLTKTSSLPLTSEDLRTIQRNIARARQEFVNDSNITYQEMDGIDNPDAYSLDDIVEIFIRANSGGTKLGKSDLLFSLLTSSWDEAEGEMESLLEELNKDGFKFDRDFVLKACLTTLGKGARYEVNKFRDGKTKEEIIEKWQDLSDAIKAVKDFVTGKTFIRTDKAMSSYLGLIPLIYLRYHYPSEFDARQNEMANYLLRVLITGVFGGNPDNLIDKLVQTLSTQKDFVLTEIFATIRADGRSLEVTPDSIFGQSYGSRGIHLLFNLWYQGFNYTPAFQGNEPQVDHIFPQSILKKIKVANPENGKMNLLRYRQEDRDQIANCALLTASQNGFTGKSDTPPSEWFARDRFKSEEEQQKFLNLHLIPADPALWQIERFDDFIAARKQLIADKFEYLLQKKRAPDESTLREGLNKAI